MTPKTANQGLQDYFKITGRSVKAVFELHWRTTAWVHLTLSMSPEEESIQMCLSILSDGLAFANKQFIIKKKPKMHLISPEHVLHSSDWPRSLPATCPPPSLLTALEEKHTPLIPQSAQKEPFSISESERWGNSMLSCWLERDSRTEIIT